MEKLLSSLGRCQIGQGRQADCANRIECQCSHGVLRLLSCWSEVEVSLVGLCGMPKSLLRAVQVVRGGLRLKIFQSARGLACERAAKDLPVVKQYI